MQLPRQRLWAGVSIDETAPGYVVTEPSRGVTFRNATLAISGSRELFTSGGLLFLGAPSRATVEQRNGRVGRISISRVDHPTAASTAQKFLHPGVDRETIPHPSGSEFLQDPLAGPQSVRPSYYISPSEKQQTPPEPKRPSNTNNAPFENTNKNEKLLGALLVERQRPALGSNSPNGKFPQHRPFFGARNPEKLIKQNRLWANCNVT